VVCEPKAATRLSDCAVVFVVDGINNEEHNVEVFAAVEVTGAAADAVAEDDEEGTGILRVTEISMGISVFINLSAKVPSRGQKANIISWPKTIYKTE
jgi:hypothetical protein